MDGAEIMDEKFTAEFIALVQEKINGGQAITVRKQESKIHVAIRYNNMDTDGSQKWRVLIDGRELLVSDVCINIPCKTESKLVDFVGIRHHISCSASKIEFARNIANIS